MTMLLKQNAFVIANAITNQYGRVEGSVSLSKHFNPMIVITKLTDKDGGQSCDGYSMFTDYSEKHFCYFFRMILLNLKNNRVPIKTINVYYCKKNKELIAKPSKLYFAVLKIIISLFSLLIASSVSGQTNSPTLRSESSSENKQVITPMNSREEIIKIPNKKVMGYTELKLPFWLTLDFGTSSSGFTANTSMNLMSKKLLFTAEASMSSTASFSHFYQSKSFTDYGIFSFMVGRVFLSKDEATIYSISTGLSFATISDHTPSGYNGWFGPEFNENSMNTIGIPVDFKVYFSPRRAVGLDLDLKLDLNVKRPLIGLMIGMRFGRIKPKLI